MSNDNKMTNIYCCKCYSDNCNHFKIDHVIEKVKIPGLFKDKSKEVTSRIIICQCGRELDFKFRKAICTCGLIFIFEHEELSF